MDYKELLNQLKDIMNHGDDRPSGYCTNSCGGCDACAKSIEAIETLLKKLDDTQDRLQDLQTTLDMYGGECGINEAFRKAEELNMAIDGIRINGV